ncbi:MAG: hypothetical protein ACYCRE_04080 [Acidobacteriaceae bacterium]
MNLIPAINVAPSRLAMPTSAIANPGASAGSSAFADAMRSAFSPAHASQAAPNRSATSVSSRSQSSSGRHANSVGDPVSQDNSQGATQAGQVPNGSPVAQAANGAVENATPSSGMSSQDSIPGGDGPAPTTVQAMALAQTEKAAIQSGAGPAKEDSGSATQSAGLPAVPARKETPSAKGANSGKIGSASVSPAIATSTPVIAANVSATVTNVPAVAANVSATVTNVPAVAANVPAAVTNTPAAKQSGSRSAGPGTTADATGGPGPDAIHPTSKDFFTATSATAPTLPARAPQEGASAILPQSVGVGVKAAAMMPEQVAVPSREPAGGPAPVPSQRTRGAQVEQGNNERPAAASNSASATSTTSTSPTDQNVGPAGNAGGSQAAGKVEGGPANAPTTGSVNAGADTNPSGASTTGTPNTPDNGSPAFKSGSGPFTHDGNSTGASSVTSAALPPNSATASGSAGAFASSLPLGPGVPHGNAADPGAGIHGSSSVFSAPGHSSVAQNPGPSGAGLAAGRGTSSDAFAALDSAAAGERGVLLHAAPHQVAVGIADPSLGWVEVRAERIAGQVAAALTADSTASHAALTSVLPSMATYLQEQRAGVQQIHVEAGLAGGQPGTGSQGQPSSQGDARTSPDTVAMASPGDTGWAVAPPGGGPIPASLGTNSMFEGRRFSIRA